MRGFATVSVLLWMLVWIAAAGDPSTTPAVGGPAVRVVGLSVVRPPATQQPLVPGWGDGTQVCLLVLRQEGGIVGIDDDASHVNVFADDQRTDLLVNDLERLGSPRWSRHAAISPDGKAIRLIVETRAYPAKNATKVRVAGCVAISVAKNTALAVHEAVLLQKGVKLDSGPISLEIMDATDDDGEMTLGLRISGDRAAFIDIMFVDEEGRRVKGSANMWWVEGPGVLREAYELEERLDAATVLVKYWADRRTILVPFDVTTSLGLPEPRGGQEDQAGQNANPPEDATQDSGE